MWNGGHPNDDPSQRGQDDNHTRLTASALVAYATSGAAAAGFPNPMVYPPPHAQHPGAYHLDAVAAAAAAHRRPDLDAAQLQIRAQQHQEQMRQQAILAQLQQQHHPAVYHPHAMDEMEYARQIQAARHHQQAAKEMAMQQLWEANQRGVLTGGPENIQRGMSSEPSEDERSYRSDEEDDEDMMASGANTDVEEMHPPPMSNGDVSNYMVASGVASAAPRGKPEAMAKALAAARIHEKMEELQAEHDGVDVIAEPVEEADDDDDEDDDIDVKVEEDVAPAAVLSNHDGEKKSKPKKPRKKPAAPAAKKAKAEVMAPSLEDPVPDMTDVEYECLEALMIQFCRVPLLAEFSRPVSVLHPELIGNYNKIVRHAIDLGTVCRAIRRREYKNSRSFRLDMWRIFANCVKYHSHPSNKDAVPSFVSIALHLREYFNALWQEYMMPSDPPSSSPSSGKRASHTDVYLREAFAKREEDRQKRLGVTGVTGMTAKCLERTVHALHTFFDQDGCVDRLDKDPIFGEDGLPDDDGDVRVVVDNLRKLQQRLAFGKADDESYGLEELSKDLRLCYELDVLENKPAYRVRIGNRLNRFLGKIIVPIHEASCRGVGQSSIWGCMAAAVWARENGKKPFWPALVLGILAPEDQQEEWHAALTSRNEQRLPEKLRAELNNGKRKAEQAIRRQSLGHAEPQSYFLVEFLGTHEFIWVKEADLIENFDPEDDPNQAVAAGNVTKKKRSSRSNPASVAGTKTFATAVEEGRWALEEFEMLLQDSGGDPVEEEEDSGEMNYSYAVLSQADDDSDVADEPRNKDTSTMTMSDVEEANELLATDGLLDYSVAGRKNAKKRAAAMKKHKADMEKKERADNAKKGKESSAKKKKESKSPDHSTVKVEKGDKRDGDKKKKKRGREREKVVKESKRPAKKPRTTSPDSHDAPRSRSVAVRRNLIDDKRGRATAIVRGYLARLARIESAKNVIGAVTIPASVVDSSNLLGMALAFRAAAGEISMPDSAENPKPWEAFDADSPSTAKERCEMVTKQMRRMEAEIKRLKSSIAQRKQLTLESVERFNAIEKEIYIGDSAARKSNQPVKKKPQKAEKSPAAAKGKVEDVEEDARGDSDGEDNMDDGQDNWATQPPIRADDGDSD